ncbi:hypothetical protein Dimus_002634 [Dionaea muscipula]
MNINLHSYTKRGDALFKEDVATESDDDDDDDDDFMEEEMGSSHIPVSDDAIANLVSQRPLVNVQPDLGPGFLSAGIPEEEDELSKQTIQQSLAIYSRKESFYPTTLKADDVTVNGLIAGLALTKSP